MYKKKSSGLFKHFDFIVLDVLSIEIAMIIAYMIRHGWQNPYKNSLYSAMAVFLVLADMIIIYATESFQGVLRRGYYLEIVAVLKQALFLEFLSMVYLVTTQKAENYSRSVLYLMGVIYVPVTYILRFIWKKFLRRRNKNHGKKSLYIISTRNLAERCIASINKINYGEYQITGIILTDCNCVGETICGIPVVTDIDNAADYICQRWVDEVFISLEDRFVYPKELIDSLTEMGLTVHLKLLNSAEASGSKQFVEKMGDYTVLTSSMNYATARQAFIKRAMDIIIGLIGCVCTGIIFIFIAPIIYVNSPGPIFYSQERVGQNGKRFRMYKFRSMYLDADERKKELMSQNKIADGRMFKMDFDPRIIGNKIMPDGTKKTGIGQFIRKTSLDEFPQFYNVLRGDLSVVGPRPCLPDEWALYEKHHRARFAIKPGITGMWQVSGRSNIDDFEEVVRLDTEYIEKWNIGLDIKIFFKTIEIVAKGEGSM